MKLQSALREREEEISLLEASLHASQHSGSSVAPSVAGSPKISTGASNGSSYFQTPRGGSPDGDADVRLSPRTVAAFEKLKSDLADENAGEHPIDAESSARLDEIMRSMAKKEEGHREVIDALNDQLVALKRQHEELTVLSRDQVVNMSSEIGRLRSQLDGRPEAEHYEARLKNMQDDLDQKHTELGSSRDQAAGDLSATSDRLVEGALAFLERVPGVATDPCRMYRARTRSRCGHLKPHDRAAAAQGRARRRAPAAPLVDRVARRPKGRRARRCAPLRVVLAHRAATPRHRRPRRRARR